MTFFLGDRLDYSVGLIIKTQNVNVIWNKRVFLAIKPSKNYYKLVNNYRSVSKSRLKLLFNLLTSHRSLNFQWRIQLLPTSHKCVKHPDIRQRFFLRLNTMFWLAFRNFRINFTFCPTSSFCAINIHSCRPIAFLKLNCFFRVLWIFKRARLWRPVI